VVSYLNVKRRRDFRRRRWQYGAVALTIFLGVLMFAGTYDAYRNLDASYRRTYERLALADFTAVEPSPGFAISAAELPDVAGVSARHVADVPIRVHGGSSFLGRIVGMPADNQPAVNRIDLTDGAYLSSSLPSRVVLETHMADHFGLGPGDTVEYYDGRAWRPVTVGGVAVSPEYLWPARSAQEVLASPDTFGVVFASDRVVTSLPPSLVRSEVGVVYAEGADVPALDSRLRALASANRASSVMLQVDQPSNKALQLDVMGFQQMAVAFPVMFLLAAAVATYTLLNRLVYSEREIIGTLRANGLSRGSVVRHYLSYGLWLGGIGGLLGVALGVPMGWGTTFAYTAELGIPDTIREVRLATVVIGIAFGFATGFVSSWAPARAASHLEPATAMRGETPTLRSAASLAERVLPPLRRLPAAWKMVLRGISRNPRRSFATVLGVVLSLILILASWGLIDTVRILLDRQFTEIQLEDATIVFDEPVTSDSVANVGGVLGVADAERAYALPVTASGAKGSYATQALAFAADTHMHTFSRPLGAGVILGTSMRGLLGVEVGDTVRLAFTGLKTSATARVDGFADEPLGSLVYMSRSTLERLLEGASPPVGQERLVQPDTSVVLVRFDPGVDRASVISRLRDLDTVVAVTDARALYETANRYLGLFYVFVGLMLGFGGIMAFALIFNTMSVNLAERVGEFATMRANGFSQRRLAVLIVGESLLLTLVAIPFGLLAGWWAASRLMASYSSDMFDFGLAMYPSTYVLAGLSMVVVTLISLWPGIRATGRIDLGAVMRQRSV
jgi:putative ABC transport system permease protein